MPKYLAHSARGASPAQSYEAHVGNVTKSATRFAQEAERYSGTANGSLVNTVHSAALLHDLGKLDDANQAVLREKNSRRKLPVNHVDAGCAELLKEGRALAALTVYSHHGGLPVMPSELVREENMLRDNHPAMRVHTSSTLPELLRRQAALIPGKLADQELPFRGGGQADVLSNGALLPCGRGPQRHSRRLWRRSIQ